MVTEYSVAVADTAHGRLEQYLSEKQLASSVTSVLPLTGDASDRRYYRVLLKGGDSVVLALHVVMPGTIGSLRASFFPEGGLIAEQSSNPGWRGSGRIADIGPAAS